MGWGGGTQPGHTDVVRRLRDTIAQGVKTEIAPLCSRNVYSWKQGNYVKLMLSEQNKSSLHCCCRCRCHRCHAYRLVLSVAQKAIKKKKTKSQLWFTLSVTLPKRCKNDSRLSPSDATLNEGDITCLRFCLQGHVTALIHGRLLCLFQCSVEIIISVGIGD